MQKISLVEKEAEDRHHQSVLEGIFAQLKWPSAVQTHLLFLCVPALNGFLHESNKFGGGARDAHKEHLKRGSNLTFHAFTINL